MMMGADARLVHPGDESRTRRRTDRRSGERPGEKDALAGKSVEMRRRDRRFTVAAQMGTDIIGKDPDNVGPRHLQPPHCPAGLMGAYGQQEAARRSLSIRFSPSGGDTQYECARLFPCPLPAVGLILPGIPVLRCMNEDERNELLLGVL